MKSRDRWLPCSRDYSSNIRFIRRWRSANVIRSYSFARKRIDMFQIAEKLSMQRPSQQSDESHVRDGSMGLDSCWLVSVQLTLKAL